MVGWKVGSLEAMGLCFGTIVTTCMVVHYNKA
jgi:hypothetical protein